MTAALAPIRAIGLAILLTARAARAIGGRDPLLRARAAAALRQYGWAPLPILIALQAIVGLVCGIVAARILALYHVELAVEPFVVTTLCRDAAPFVLGVLAVGRLAVDLAALLAGAALSQQIDTLEVLGRDPVRYYLSPALLAALIAIPIQMLVAVAASLAATALALDLAGQTRLATFLALAASQATMRAVAGGLARAASYTLIAFAVGAAVGASGARTPEEVGLAANRAFTVGLIAIFAAAALWTVLG